MRLNKVSTSSRCDVCHKNSPSSNVDMFTQACSDCLPVLYARSNYSIVSTKISSRLFFLGSYLYDTRDIDNGTLKELLFSSISVLMMSLIPYTLAESKGQELPIFSSIFMFGMIIVAYFIQKYIDIFD